MTDTADVGGGAAPVARSSRRRRILVIIAIAVLVVVGAIVAGACWLTSSVAGPRRSCAPVRRHQMDGPLSATPGRATLRVLTLNVAHGRGTALHQALLGAEQITGNLEAIALMLRREGADVVALQEADGPSAWSGDFDHVTWVASEAGYQWSVRGSHVSSEKLSYGTALLVTREPTGALSISFAPSPPTFTKGFVVASVPWPAAGLTVDVVSVHLDFSRGSVRRSQVDELVGELRGRANPVIVMGDFNCGWRDEDSPLRRLAEELQLSAYEPDATAMASFPTLGTRIDWILVSPGLVFVECHMAPERVSDHLAVVAEIAVAGQEQTGE